MSEGKLTDYAGARPSRCTWTPGTTEPNPHTTRPPIRNEKILDNILEHIGNTPVVRINRIGKEAGLKCDLVAKCEFFNSGGSVKDRIGARMVADAEEAGRIHAGDTLIEPTSGNTGIGLALAAAVRGYKMVITMPEKMSQEKVDVLKGLGAEIVRTPTEASFDSPDSHIAVAERLNKEIPNSHILDQYRNPGNPLAHYDGTAEEIIAQCNGRLDMVVISAGTGGTISGIARKLKEKMPNVTVVGVDPVGSILAEPSSLNVPGPGYQVEGIGYDFVPTVLDRTVVDRWVKTGDRESLSMAKRLISEEGLLCGGSSGAAMWAATQAAKDLGPDQRCLVVLPDSIRNYMTKHLSDDWMVEHGLMEPPETDVNEWWHGKTVGSLNLGVPETLAPTITVSAAIDAVKSKGYDMFPVVDEDGTLLGTVTEGNLLAKLVGKRVTADDPVTKCLYKFIARVTPETPLRTLSILFNTHPFAVVLSSTGRVIGVASRIDLLHYVARERK